MVGGRVVAMAVAVMVVGKAVGVKVVARAAVVRAAAATASTGAREGGRAAVVMAPAERAAVVITVARAVATVVAVAAVEGQHQEHTAVERVVGRGARVQTAAPMVECRTLRRS